MISVSFPFVLSISAFTVLTAIVFHSVLFGTDIPVTHIPSQRSHPRWENLLSTCLDNNNKS
jgi:hypothetical protein